MEGEQQSIPSWCRAAFALEAEYDALNEREWDAAARVWCPKQCSPWLLRAAERAGISRQPSAPARCCCLPPPPPPPAPPARHGSRSTSLPSLPCFTTAGVAGEDALRSALETKFFEDSVEAHFQQQSEWQYSSCPVSSSERCTALQHTPDQCLNWGLERAGTWLWLPPAGWQAGRQLAASGRPGLVRTPVGAVCVPALTCRCLMSAVPLPALSPALPCSRVPAACGVWAAAQPAAAAGRQ